MKYGGFMDKNAKVTFEEYLDLILGDKGFDFETLNRFDTYLLASFKKRLDKCLENLSLFNTDSNFSNDEKTLLLKLAQLEQQSENGGHIN